MFPVGQDKRPVTEHGLKDATQTIQGVREFWTRYPDAGIAVVTDALVVLDFDVAHHGIDSLQAIQEKYGVLPITRTHMTGGGGFHYLYRNPDGRNIRNTVALGGYEGVDLRANGGYIVVPPSLHPSGHRYEVTDDSPLAPAPEWLVELSTKRTQGTAAVTEDQPIPEGQRNNTLASLAGTMRRRGMPLEAIEAALIQVNLKQCNPPLSEEEVMAIAKSVGRYLPPKPPNGYVNNSSISIIERDKVLCESKRDKSVTDNVTKSLQRVSQNVTKSENVTKALSQKVESWVAETSGWWTTDELDKDLGISSKQDKDNRRQILLRLRESGLIERHLKINKQFRFVNAEITHIDIKSVTTTGILPIKWPLGVERYVNIYPGNEIVIAGAPNSGKTAFLLSTIQRNQGEFPIKYFCSEMGKDELQSRLSNFPNMTLEDWKFDPIERSSNFPDVIVPDCINIIDYLEITENLFQINDILTAIAHKVGTGLAIVAIQKKVNVAFGRGQEFGLEKPKLYLSMDKGRLSIVKGKSWVNPKVDPNGLRVTFRILAGCQFEVTKPWYRPGDEGAEE